MSPFSQSWECWAGFTSKCKNSEWGILTKNLWTDELLSNVVHQRWCRLSEKAKWNTSNEMSWHLHFAAISVLGIMRNSNSLLNWEARLKQNTNIKHKGKPWYFIRHPNNPNRSETFPYNKGTAFNKYCPFDFKIFLDENNRLHSLSHNSSILYLKSSQVKEPTPFQKSYVSFQCFTTNQEDDGTKISFHTINLTIFVALICSSMNLCYEKPYSSFYATSPVAQWAFPPQKVSDTV